MGGELGGARVNEEDSVGHWSRCLEISHQWCVPYAFGAISKSSRTGSLQAAAESSSRNVCTTHEVRAAPLWHSTGRRQRGTQPRTGLHNSRTRHSHEARSRTGCGQDPDRSSIETDDSNDPESTVRVGA